MMAMNTFKGQLTRIFCCLSVIVVFFSMTLQAADATLRTTPDSKAGVGTRVLGPTYAILNLKGGGLQFGGSTLGWSRGSIRIRVKVYVNGSLYRNFSKTCHSATGCSVVRNSAVCPAPGSRWKVVAVSSGPGGSTRDSETLLVPAYLTSCFPAT